MRIGIDVGGTHTDAVLMRGRELIAATKALTTDDISTGILNAIREILKSSGARPAGVRAVMLGTTQFTNAVVERRELAPVAAIRIGAQSTRALPVMAKWPDDLRAKADGAQYLVDGGHDYDGTEIVPFDREAVDAAAADLTERGIKAAAITAVFSSINPGAEKEAAERLRAAAPDLAISLSHEIGAIGLYQRENATILNAALQIFSKGVAAAFQSALADLGLACPLFISQNDGTLMSASFAADFPVLTFSSGPTNSMRGAAFLSGVRDAMVADIGGTTSDIGMLIGGFPRQSGLAVRIGGVLTNFRMPDVLAVGLGGGSRVSPDGARTGPQSVGRELPKMGRVFGGEVLTATDIAVAAGRADIGDRARVADLPRDVVDAAMAQIRATLEDNIDRMKTSASDLPLIVVGGGEFLCPDELAGVSEVIRPENGGVANAIGAAFAQVGGEAETIYRRDSQNREAVLAEVKRAAGERAVAAGARPETIEIIDIEETPMSYLAEQASRIRAKAVGEADLERLAPR